MSLGPPRDLARRFIWSAGFLFLMAASVGPMLEWGVRAAYSERLSWPLHGIITGQDVHPVEHYLGLVGPIASAATGLLVLLSGLLIALSSDRLRGRAFRAVTGGERGLFALWRPAGALTVLVAAALRVPALGATSLWLDEAMISMVSAAGIHDLFAKMSLDSSAPPLHHLVQFAVFSTGYWGPTAARLPSLVAGLAMVILLLLMPRWGLPRSVALGAALAVALSPAHVGFARDATQYASITLVSTLLFVFGLAVVSGWPSGDRRATSRLVFAFALAPWLGYQTVFVALAVVVGLAAQILSNPLMDHIELRRELGRAVGMPIAALAVSGIGVFLAVARTQLSHTGNWYLVGGYPSTSGLSLPRWLLEATDGFMGIVAGGQAVGRWSADGLTGLRDPIAEAGLLGWLLLVAVVLVATTVIRAVRASVVLAPGSRRAEDFALVTSAALLVGSIIAALLSIYPFGGMHQQLHSTPLVLVAAFVALRRILTVLPSPATVGVVGVVAGLYLSAALPAIPAVYGEREDIVSAIVVGVEGREERGLSAIEDGRVWVYRAAKPAVAFHFRGRDFEISTVEATDLEGMLQEVELVARGGEAALVFSHIYPHPVELDHRRALQALLLEGGWSVLEEIHHPNTVVLSVRAP